MKAHVGRLGVCAVLMVVWTSTNPSTQLRHERAPFWEIDPHDYEKVEAAPPTFPESGLLPGDRDIGVAFSGGGVRSASATIGELRGLEASGLLGRVRYVSAVSGGAWAVIPWTFSGEPELLGTYEPPSALTEAPVKTSLNGTLASAVQRVSIELDGSKEGALVAWGYNVPPESKQLLGLVRRAVNGARSADRTYASLLRSELLSPLGNGTDSDFQWDESHGAEFTFLNGAPAERVTRAQPRRPFMIVNADVLNAGDDFSYPYAIPFEFTPLYVGSRHSIGGVFGGVYTWPSAYNPATARVVLRRNATGTFDDYCARAAVAASTGAAPCAASEQRALTQDYAGILEYSHDDTHARISLSDVAASTGAAPLFFIAGGNGLDSAPRNFIRAQGSAYFPQFTHLALRGGELIRPRPKWPHADGGARDNLGIAPLLARQVKKIIAFVNVNSPDFNNNDDIASLFEPRSSQKTSDKSGNVMLAASGAPNGGEQHASSDLAQILGAFQRKRDDHQPLVTCGRYDVKANAIFNIRAYRDVHICWVYPERAGTWSALLVPAVRSIVDGQCKDCGTFESFPWFATFAENRDLTQFKNIGVLSLTKPQINLMTNLMAWTVVTSAEEIRSGLHVP